MPGILETHMNFSLRSRSLFKTIAVVLALALPTALAISSADARVGGGGSSGSRGSRTYSAPPSTTTAPGSASQFNRTYTQPGAGMNSAASAPARGGLFGRAGGFMGGLAAGFLGAGLLGMLFGGGLFGGLGGLSSILGLIIQIALVVLVVRLAMSWWQRRHTPQAAYANAEAGAGSGPQPNQRGGLGGGLGGFGFGANANNAPLEIKPDDYEAFERLLGDVQTAWSNEDVAKLHTLATPEMVSYFEQDLAQNRARNVVNKVTGVKLLQGDLAEAWREGETDYATVALRFALTDKTLDRNSGTVVAGSEQPGEVTEVWTFARRPGSGWELSAIQQTN
ncbi:MULTISPECIES: Tim44 domain-containing protein [Bradyrhizobium]|uniref:Lipid-binding transport protein (Tim44 family) n=1 Tax=Bradyrhizobium ottawaense TaxID=931866 RepID=A0ABV4G506_9BRAD|nr:MULTISPECIES: TIM44-like domain-containing protein [Bradyrhizobium]MBR1293148.1 Tim44 domain-containing protein [Bradyrhizobium ottawaense]WLB43752.1 TIM44-like domain-containing protein [Bradyrhizobium ottawaense]WQN81057.1 TIM44-like domain-containing protein [Bradyrhizobium ottawaense]BBO07492.1 membrane protein [Bradyrhizobium ottawaense]GMO25426.1 Tim44 domain-containing protein [Bradyrhizobium ottawaense]